MVDVRGIEPHSANACLGLRLSFHNYALELGDGFLIFKKILIRLTKVVCLWIGFEPTRVTHQM